MGKVTTYNELTSPADDDLVAVADMKNAGTKKVQKKNLVDNLYLSGDLKFSTKTSADSGWLVCNGAAMPRLVYPELFAVIGTTFGVGDGMTTFNLPDFKGKLPIPKTGIVDDAFENQGDTGGNKTHTLIIAELPAHTHSVDTYMPGALQFILYTSGGNYITGVNVSLMVPEWTGYTGGDGPHNNLMPYLTIGSIQIKI